MWSPLGWGRLTGKFDREHPLPENSRLHETAQFAPPVNEEYLYRVIDALKQIALETGYSVPQIALKWLLTRATVSTVLIGARNQQQLQDNFIATDLVLTDLQLQRLNQVSAVYPAYPYYPYWNGQFSERYQSVVESSLIQN